MLTFLVSYTRVSGNGRGWIWHQDRPQVSEIRWGRKRSERERERERETVAPAPYGVREGKSGHVDLFAPKM